MKLLSFVAFFSLKDWRFICWLLFKARFRALTKYFDCLENPTFSSATLENSEESVRFVPNMHQIRLYCFSSSQSWKDCFIWNSVVLVYTIGVFFSTTRPISHNSLRVAPFQMRCFHMGIAHKGSTKKWYFLGIFPK